MAKLKSHIQTQARRLGNGNWQATVWDIDEETGAKLLVAVSESETRIDALRAALGNYRAGRDFLPTCMRG